MIKPPYLIWVTLGQGSPTLDLGREQAAGSLNHVTHSTNAGDHRLGRAAGTVDRHHGGESCPAQPPDRICTKSGVLPHAVRTRGSASSMMTAVTPPMKSDNGFLNTRHETESADASAASPYGREKSTDDWSPGSSSTRDAVSKLLCNSQGRMIGAVTASKAFSCSARRTLDRWDIFASVVAPTKAARAGIRESAAYGTAE